KGQRIDEFIPRQRKREYAGGDEAWHGKRKDDANEYLQTRRSIDQRAFLELERYGFEITHQQPGAERNEESRIREDQRKARIEKVELVDHRGERNKQDRRRDQIGEKNTHADVARSPEAEPLDRVGRKHAAEDRKEGRHDRHQDRVPEPLRIRGVQEQLFDVR